MAFFVGRPIVLSFLFFLLSSKTEALPGVLGNRKQGHLFHEKQGNKCVKNEGKRVIKAILGNREIKIKVLINRGTKHFFLENKGTGTLPTPWDLWPWDHAVDCKMSPAWVGKLNMCIMHLFFNLNKNTSKLNKKWENAKLQYSAVGLFGAPKDLSGI